MTVNRRPYNTGNFTGEFQKARFEERAHIASHRETVAASGGTINVHLKNPSSNTKEYRIEQFLIQTQFRGQATVFDSFSTAPSGGTSLPIDNLRMDSDDSNGTSTATANSNVSFTEDSTHVELVVPGGGPDGASIGSGTTATPPIIESGREIVIRLTNNSSSERLASIGMIFSEQPNR